MNENIYSPEYVKALFNSMSSSYERMNYITSFGFSIRWRKEFLRPLASTDRSVEILDLLTGMGETWQGTKNRFPKCNLTALDFSEGMLEQAARKNRIKFGDEITVLQQDVLNNTLPDAHFDYVTCAFGLKTFNSEQLSRLASETKRILKPGGHFSFVEVSQPDNRILEALYGFYLGRVIPILGRLFLHNSNDYRMLWRYTTQFKSAKNAAAIFASSGLKVTPMSYFFGCATGFHGLKQHAENE
jgi:demethylmenaquinone methyltransferase/2-methoxy-6-polyprenyl-1,4-benzoquinol methylase